MHISTFIVNNVTRKKIQHDAARVAKPGLTRVSGINFQDKFIQYWSSGLAGFFNNGYIVPSQLSDLPVTGSNCSHHNRTNQFVGTI
jgi:hypothetical protein